MDLFEKCYGYTEAKDAIRDGVYPYFIPMTETEGPNVSFRDIASLCVVPIIILD